MITDSTSTFPAASPEGEPWTEILRTRRKKQLREASLVLQAKGIPHALDSRHNESFLIVPPWAVERALEQLELYAAENEGVGDGGTETPPSAPAAVSSGRVGALGFAAVLAIFYYLQVTDARPDTGGLSGATPAEAVSWGKVDPDKLPDTVVVYSDSTIAAPLLAAYALTRHEPRASRRLYDRRDAMLGALRGAYEAKGGRT